MAMTLRLTPEEDRALTMLAGTKGTSKQEAARRAIVDAAARAVRDAEVRMLAAETVEANAVVLRRLAK
ncbi:CopG family transcriptional regulator [uncultured Corynebacterium sp.]|uniref:CopG family transcriptional regulator n=1 Tax=uncultured Corynebacterium sp. TaxID=159447 RepID=UPI0025D977D2|nr:CopG family transcriptional regulator [uncultured Corynebacterium sp.]